MVLLHLFDMSNLRFMLLFVFGLGGGVVVGGLSVAILCQYDVSHNNI